jgi:hypothetical protein
MEQLINSAKTTEVAEPLLLKLDLQLFADDLGGVDPIEEPIDEPIDEPTDEDLIDDPIEPGEKVEDLADPQDPSFKDDPQNQKFAQMRREKEAAEQQMKQMDAYFAQQFGDSHGIHSFAEYQAAIEREQKEAERQQYIDAGLPEDVAEKLSKVDEVLKQAEQEKFDRLLTDGFSDLKKEYPGLVKTAEDIPVEVFAKWDDGKTGLSLTEAYELVNKKAIREHLQASSKQKALNQINSKSHLRGNGGQGADDVDLTSIPTETLTMYRQMFKKELRSGSMKESDFVKHYKDSQ